MPSYKMPNFKPQKSEKEVSSKKKEKSGYKHG
jgi:hypothetical protein